MANELDAFKFQNRTEAGYILANRLQSYASLRDVAVLALPRGGVVVGAEIARRLNVPLLVFLVRKLGVPGHEELAMGAIASGGRPLVDAAVTRKLRIAREVVDGAVRRETRELSRLERLYCGGRKMPDLKDKIVILTDDGATTGSSLSLAVQAVRQQGAAYVIVAVPVAPALAVSQLSKVADQVICLIGPKKFVTVSHWYEEFPRLTDREICQILERSPGPVAARKTA